ncbi:MAG: aminomethyl-transferring glycine dehydrogenase subunit GcvPB [Candidatus Izemoplasmatales bacterium]
MVKDDLLLFEMSVSGRVGYQLPKSFNSDYSMSELDGLLRKEAPSLPEVSELDTLRHFTNISKKNFGVENGFYPLGSCTMKYNPKINEEIASFSGFNHIHPLQSASSVQGALKMAEELSASLSELSGMDEFSLNPYAGAHGELTGLMIMKKYHEDRKDFKRTKVIVPDSAHGTNPASTAVCGMEVIEIPSTEQGTVDIEALKAVLNDEVAGIMLTNPNTVGIFERDILTIASLVHDAGGLLYYDGANLNALLGVARPGDMGFDIIHINLHKTFSTPHGGGGPGSGPVGVVSHLAHLLPNPRVKKLDDSYYLEYSKDAIGSVSSFLGNFKVWVRALTYIKTLGRENLKLVGPYAVLNANYIQKALENDYFLPIKGFSMHECVFDGLIDQSTGVKTLDVAKRLLDYGMHAPTIYFPLLFHQAIMIEPTETESKQTIDEFIRVMKDIAQEAISNPEILKSAPHHTPITRIDEVYAAKKMILTYKDYLEEQKNQ